MNKLLPILLVVVLSGCSLFSSESEYLCSIAGKNNYDTFLKITNDEIIIELIYKIVTTVNNWSSDVMLNVLIIFWINVYFLTKSGSTKKDRNGYIAEIEINSAKEFTIVNKNK